MIKIYSFAVALFLLCLASAHAGQKQATLVLTSLDVVQVMAEALTHDTSIEIRNVVPHGYSMQGHDAYFKKHRKTFLETASQADAVLTLNSAWPADPLYRWARRANIRIVNIDTTRPLDGYGAGVPLVTIDGVPSPYVWRSPANLARMAVITAGDLAKLSPQDAIIIKANLEAMQSKLFTLRSRYEEAFLELECVEMAAMTSDYTYLADEFGLDIRFSLLTPERTWIEAEESAFASRLAAEDVKGVICSWEPEARTIRAIRQGGAIPVVLKRFIRSPENNPVTDLAQWYDTNLARLLKALKR